MNSSPISVSEYSTLGGTSGKSSRWISPSASKERSWFVSVACYAAPTSEHFLPIIYLLGASKGEKAEIFNNVCNLSAIAMTGFVIGWDEKQE